MKRLISILLLALTPLVGLPAAANAYGTGTFAVANVQLKDYGCFYHPYAANLSLGAETTDWEVDVRVLAPNGTIFDTSYGYGTGYGARTLTGEMFFCSSLDQPGVYTITGVLSTYEGTYDYTPTNVSLSSVQFTVSPYVAPTPPPPPPAPAPVVTYADVKGSVSKQFITRGIKFTFRSQAIPAGSTVREPLRWSVLVDNKVKGPFTQDPGTNKVKQYTFAKGSGAHKIKVLRNGKVAMKVTVRA